MSKFFVDPSERAAIHDDDNPDNVVWIKAKMDRATAARVQDDLLRLQLNAEQMEGGKAPSRFNLTVGIESQKLALLIHNIVKWEGPDFVNGTGKPIPCTRERIEGTDARHPFFEKIVQEINRRNTPKRAEPASEEEANSPNSSDSGISAT